jgi:cell division protein FtsN
MEQRSADPGAELVLDNRKLILGFVLLVAMCGACFVIGFMEGKRQAVQAKIESIAPMPAAAGSGTASSTPASPPPAASVTTNAAKDKNARDQLDWYKNVQRGESGVPKTPPKPEAVSPTQAPEQKDANSAPPKNTALPGPEPAVPAGKVTYSVQVGAFRQLKEAETAAAGVRGKGFECAIESPSTTNTFYLVKVGPFKTRADAVAMKNKLSKAGFSCYIKFN